MNYKRDFSHISPSISFTTRSPTTITLLHAICQIPTLTEPDRVSCFLQSGVGLGKKNRIPFGANGKANHHVSGPNQPGGR